MARSGGKGGLPLDISLRIVVFDLENTWQDLECSYQKSVGTLRQQVGQSLNRCKDCRT